MKQKIINIAAICVLILIMIGTILFLTIKADGINIIKNPTTTISEDYIPSETVISNTQEENSSIILEPIIKERVTPNSLEEATALLQTTKDRKNLVIQSYDNLLILGYDKDHPAVMMLRFEIDYSDFLIQYYQKKIDEFEEVQKWEKRMEEYPTATTVWKYMTESMEYSDAVAAGIIGNMMAECGGQTLNLNWKALNSTGHYGLCQWSTGFRAVRGADLQGQLDFMAISFPQQIDQWGSICYKKGFTYKDFLQMEDPGEVAYAFCVIYERPGPGTYNQRRYNAQVAYEYFTS